MAADVPKMINRVIVRNLIISDSLQNVLQHIIGVRDKIRACGSIGNVRASYDILVKENGCEFNDPILYEIGFNKEETWLRDEYISLKISWRLAEHLLNMNKDNS